MKFSAILESIAKLFTGNGFPAARAVDKHVDQIIGREILNGAGGAGIYGRNKVIKKCI